MKRYFFIFILIWLNTSCSNFLEEYSQDLSKVENYTDLDELLIGDGYWRPGKAYLASSVLKMDEPYLMSLHLMSDETEIFRKANNADILNIRNKFFGWATWQRQVGIDFKKTKVDREDIDWNELYKRINIVNQIIAHIDQQAADGEKEQLEKVRIKGEACFLRAIYYFTLVNMYAKPFDPATAANEPGIPVKLSQKIEDKEYVSESLAKVYETILADLKNARECLRQTPVKNHPYRADIVAAHLLTSRVYLYMQDWQNARNYADSVIVRKGELENLNHWNAAGGADFLSRSSVETIFSMGGHLLAPALYSTDAQNAMGQVLRYPVYIISKDLISLYGADSDNSDLRRGIYIRQITPMISYVPSTPVWVFGKVDGPRSFKNGTTAFEVSDVYLMRVAEAYLNAAEAAAQLGKTAEAVELLKRLRQNRVTKDVASYGDGASLIQFIRDERERELCLEGHRWFDLRRYMVDSRYPFSKKIVHYYTDFNSKVADPNTGLKYQTLRYVLEENDPAYTLALPKEVTDFQNTLPSVERPERMETVYNEYEGVDMAKQGYDDGLRGGKAIGKADKLEEKNFVDSNQNPRFYDYQNKEYSVFTIYAQEYAKGFKSGYAEGYGDK